MPSDAAALADRLLDAHVAHVLAELTGPDGAAMLADDVRGAVAALGDVRVDTLVDRDAAVGDLADLLDRVVPSPAVEAMARTLAPALRSLPAAEQHTLGEVVDRARVEEVVDVLATSTTLREEVLRRLTDSPTIAVLSLRFVQSLVGDAVQQNRQRAEKVPGMRLAMGMGDFAARQARGMAPKQLGKVVGGAADRGAQAAMERVSRALVEVVDEQVVRDAAMELWDLHADEPVASLRAYLTEEEVVALADAAHGAARGAAGSPLVRAVVVAAVDGFLDRHGDGTVAELLADLGLDADHLAGLVASHAPRVVAALARDGHLEALLRRRLAGFYEAPATRELLAGT